MAVLMLAGLLALNPHRPRDLALADSAGEVALAILLFGFVITFGSTAMGSAVMMFNKPARNSDPDGRSRRIPIWIKLRR